MPLPSTEKNTVRQFRFLDRTGAVIAPQQWLQMWSDAFPDDKYDAVEHDRLVTTHEFSAADFVRIGKWKDDASAKGRWKPNVASVAYDIWNQAADECPRCPDESGVRDFLKDWSERTYTNTFANGPVVKRFGLSRSTALLYFLSNGRFPIFDSRVRTAVGRLTGVRPPNTVAGYLDRYCPLFAEIGTCCDTQSARLVDRALFSYGAKSLRF